MSAGTRDGRGFRAFDGGMNPEVPPHMADWRHLFVARSIAGALVLPWGVTMVGCALSHGVDGSDDGGCCVDARRDPGDEGVGDAGAGGRSTDLPEAGRGSGRDGGEGDRGLPDSRRVGTCPPSLRDDPYEHNDSVAAAVPIGLEAVAGTLCADQDRERNEDYYALPSYDGYRYFWMTVEPGIAAAVFFLDADGEVVSYGDTGSGTTIGHVMTGPRTTHARIVRFNSTAAPCTCADYTLEVGTHVLW